MKGGGEHHCWLLLKKLKIASQKSDIQIKLFKKDIMLY